MIRVGWEGGREGGRWRVGVEGREGGWRAEYLCWRVGMRMARRGEGWVVDGGVDG